MTSNVIQWKDFYKGQSLVQFKGKKKNWQVTQTLWWKGIAIHRHSKEYQLLLNRVYNAMYQQSASFYKALHCSGRAVLKHSMGKNSMSDTVLTTQEFCSRLMYLRDIGLLTEDIEQIK